VGGEKAEDSGLYKLGLGGETEEVWWGEDSGLYKLGLGGGDITLCSVPF
jgi:hypothetical protein